MPLESPKNFREITKKYASKERKETAFKIREIRHSYFEDVDLIKENLAKINPQKLEKDQEILKIENEINNFENEIRDLKSSIIKTLLNRKEMAILDDQKKIVQQKLKDIICERELLVGKIEELNKRLDNKDKLDEAKNLLQEFYQKQIELFPSYKEREKREFLERIKLEKNDRDAAILKNVIKKYNKAIVHGVRMPQINVGENSLMKDYTSWQIKIKTLIGIEPTISTSSISSNSSRCNYWLPFGAFLNEGTVLAANDGDMGSIALGTETRNFENYKPPLGQMEKVITNAIYTVGRYNEIIVDNPSVCGLYILELKENNYDDKSVTPPHEEIKEMSEELELPVFIIADGKYWDTTYNPKTKKYIKNKEVDNPSLADNKVSEITKTKIKEEILNNFPLKIDGWKDFADIESSACGRELFIKLGYVDILPKIKSKGEKLTINNNEVEKITTYRGAGAEFTLYLKKKENNYILVRSDAVNKEELVQKIESDTVDRIKGDYVYIGHRNAWKLDQPFYGIRDYTEAIGKTISNIKNKIENQKFKSDKEEMFLKTILKRLAYHAYGFSDQAKEFGDTKASEVAYEIAEKVLSYNEYLEVFDRRLGPKGEMRITEKDLEKIE